MSNEPMWKCRELVEKALYNVESLMVSAIEIDKMRHKEVALEKLDKSIEVLQDLKNTLKYKLEFPFG